ncbi:MAG TPA: hypothetical protein VGM37_10785 [Armatimonadota bacterium]|jgi:hypothetical protein
MTIRIEPHFRVQILPNVGAADKDGGLWLFVEVENSSEETVSSLNLVAAAYTADGTICAVDESSSYLTIRSGERKALRLRIDAEPTSVDSIRLYAETEFDEDDPYHVDDTLAEPPTFMKDYFHRRPTPGSED